ncbi:MAG: FAD-dependent oxidoreductase [Pseudomonadota bacterium]
MDRRFFLAGGAAALTGCSTPFAARGGDQRRFAWPTFEALNLHADRIMRITVCTRPFRAQGPRLEAEVMGGKRVVHNYGHGGSGWSLSWGCASEAASLALQDGARRIAVIGAGVIGMTTAIRLAETGAQVTVYAKDLPMETRSARATGVWSPSSRIALANAAAADFPDKWERWSRASYAAHLRHIGDSAESISLQPRYFLRDEPRKPRIPGVHDFMHLENRTSDMTPRWRSVPADSLPFNVDRAFGGPDIVFNIAGYTERLIRDFHTLRGRIVRKAFPDAGAVLSLSEDVIVNCTGYGAKALWGADDLTPVRGQIAWLPTQPAARYGVMYNGVLALSRRDGVIIQALGPNEDFGFGDDSETTDREEAEAAIATMRPVFESA